MVLLGHGRHGQDRALERHALAVGHARAGQHLDHGGVPGAALDLQAHLAVVDQQQLARLHGREDLRVGHAHARLVAGGLVEVDGHDVAGLHVDEAVGELAEAELGALQVGQDAERPVEHLGGGAHGGVGGGVVVVGAVAEVQAEHVRAGPGQGDHLIRRPAGRAQGGDDARAPLADHGSPPEARAVSGANQPLSAMPANSTDCRVAHKHGWMK